MTGENYVLLPSGVVAFGEGLNEKNVKERVQRWQENITNMAFFLILAGSRTAEIEGISAAGSTPVSRRYTAVADAELLLRGPLFPKRWPLPPLPAGVSPALISYVASRFLKIKPTIISAGLLQTPPFTHVSLESPEIGPARCLSSGNAMEKTRVQLLLDGGFKIGKKLKKSLLITECVPGGTSTAFAVLSGLGINVNGLISGSHRNPPSELKTKLVSSLFQREIGILSTDLLIITAMAGLNLPLLVNYWVPISILALGGLIWNLAGMLIFSRLFFKEEWFERAIAEFGNSTGVAASGLLLLRLADPRNSTNTLPVFSIKQLFLQPLLSGGLITVIAPLFISNFGLKGWTEFCGLISLSLCVVAISLQSKYTKASA